MTQDERITHARSRCLSCRAHWTGTDALVRAEKHARLEHHRVEGLAQTTLRLDMRKDHP